ncbi:SWIM zinc finger family protein [Glutamicibacter sp. 363]
MPGLASLSSWWRKATPCCTCPAWQRTRLRCRCRARC